MSVPLTVPRALGGRTVRLWATEYRPDGNGPFPAIVLSHGSAPTAQDRAKYTGKYAVARRVFPDWKVVALAAAVRLQHDGRRANSFYVEAGMETARDIAAAGWGSLAAVSRGDVPVAGVINFAGGRGGKQQNIARSTSSCGGSRLARLQARFRGRCAHQALTVPLQRLQRLLRHAAGISRLIRPAPRGHDGDRYQAQGAPAAPGRKDRPKAAVVRTCRNY